MSLEKTRAIPLSSIQQGESNKVISILTEKYGKIHALAHGARKISSQFGSALEPGTLSGMLLYSSRKSDLFTIKEASVIDSHKNIKTNLDDLDQLFKLLSIIKNISPLHVPDIHLFSEVCELLDVFNLKKVSCLAVALYSRMLSLRFTGLMPDWDEAIIQSKLSNIYLTAHGILNTDKVNEYGTKGRVLSKFAVKVFSRISRIGITALINTSLTESQYKELIEVLDMLM
ncbi:MAG: DNA repair protein RecO [Spirochaetes bacterium]|nr:DNA repair protein RecO [Spirochaetota bacterium]